MRLAEALIERKNMKDSIDNLRKRLESVAKVQEGDTPAENPKELLEAIVQVKYKNSINLSFPVYSFHSSLS